ncbi:MAG: hypothetical protein COT74_07525 [Bdellovibrionales bacterium CG10_big_fil_rev_8_21_14_0_10_45_34]|nr:MAG: hypothetical protein COT74_07525 [Bdellovibrionales bacterium CG10_big_fil_rev_8_21_14_0_10_45_34]
MLVSLCYRTLGISFGWFALSWISALIFSLTNTATLGASEKTRKVAEQTARYSPRLAPRPSQVARQVRVVAAAPTGVETGSSEASTGGPNYYFHGSEESFLQAILRESASETDLNFWQWNWYLNRAHGIQGPAPETVGSNYSLAIQPMELIAWWRSVEQYLRIQFDSRQSDLPAENSPQDFFCKSGDQKKFRLWWNQFPRFTYHSEYSKAQAVNANVVTVAIGAADEGRGPLFRQLSMNDSNADRQRMRQNGIKQLAWIEGQGQARTFISAINKLRQPVFLETDLRTQYQIDPFTSAAKILAHHWNWRSHGPDVNSGANTIAWVGLHSYVNNEPWLGPWGAQGERFPMRTPTYPDGRPAVGYLKSEYDPTSAIFYDANAGKDVNGEIYLEYEFSEKLITGYHPLKHRDGRTVYVGDISFNKDMASSWWLEYNLSAVKYFLNSSLDGFWIDNHSGWDFLSNRPVSKAFGDWSVHGFKKFILDKTALQFGEVDIRSYLKRKFEQLNPNDDSANTDSSTWSDPKWLEDEVWMAFLSYKIQVAKENAQKLFDGIKESAQAAGKDRDDIYVGANDIPTITYGALDGSEFDMVNTEYNPGWSLDTGAVGRGLPPNGGAGGFYALATNLSKSRHAVVWYYLDGEYYSKYVLRPGLGELLGYEALANNVILNTGESSPRIAGTDQSSKTINDVIQKMAPYFENRERRSSLAVVFSSDTQVSQVTPGGPAYFDRQPNGLGYYGWVRALEKLNVPYTGLHDSKLNRDGLADIKTLILPHVLSISDMALNNGILPFLDSGGTLVITGADSGKRHSSDRLFQSRDNAVLAQLKNRQSLGQVVFVEENLGLNYYLDSSNIEKLSAIQEILKKLEITGGYVRELNVSGFNGPIHTVLHGDSCAQKLFLDIVNINFELESDTLNPSSGGNVAIKLPQSLVGKNLEVDFFDSELGSQFGVNYLFDQKQNLIVRVPAFRKFGSLRIQHAPN